MNYEQKYNEALERARKIENGELLGVPNGTSIPMAIFPELKESKDERIRKELIDFVKSRLTGFPQCEKYIAWLEKQGEQKSVDKVEINLKIEEGKWYVCISQFCNCIEGRVYKATSDSRIIDDFGAENNMHSNAYKYFRLWTIKDAKDGDVLAEDSCIFIIQKLCGITAAKTYCTLFDDGDFDDGSTLYFDIDSTKPASKEQCDLLFQKMKEAGYEWDANKKELIKL